MEDRRSFCFAVLGKAGIVRRLVYMQLHIRVGVGSTKVKVRAANVLV